MSNDAENKNPLTEDITGIKMDDIIISNKSEVFDFIKNYKEKKELDKIPEPESVIEKLFNYRKIRFYLSFIEHTNLPLFINPSIIFEIDDEDLEYFYNKYSKKLEDEKNAKIKEIEKKYDNLV